ncbi:MAG TPA: S9 family peptidase [Acidimicrobiaceae bacterium]|nr:S9 family peptidase [Acidimicrobiaceae bacterium]
MRTPAAYGTWPSPIPASLLVQAAVRLGDVQPDGDALVWLEGRPAEGGRYQLVRRTADGTLVDLLPDGFGARTRVHEYGGGSFWLHDGTVFFTNWADQRLYRLAPGGQPQAITPEPATPHALRYADGVLSADGRWVVCVRERHDGEQAIEVVNDIVAVPSDGIGPEVVLVHGRDFVSSPRLSPDGATLVWVAWDHPNMPWDDTELWSAQLSWSHSGPQLSAGHRLAGRPGESVMQPVWSPDGSLYVISDRSNWWHVYRVEGTDQLTAIDLRDTEVGGPAWVFGERDVVAGADGQLVWVESAADGVDLVVAHGDGAAVRHHLPFVGLHRLSLVDEAVVGVADWATKEAEIVRVPLADPTSFQVIRAARDLGLDPAGLSVGRPVSYPSTNGRTAHARFYPPTSATHEGLPGETPPLLVTIHSGPTAAAHHGFKLQTQFWTSRGFAVVDVDYGGSTGYGRAYRKELEGQWGVVDVDDCCAASTWLAAQGLADPQRLAITGGSAGGFTTLAALATRTVFAVGASYYGVADLGALAADTHKFESRYLDRLVGPWPDTTGVYRERSPLSHVDGFDRPLIVFQGLEDAIVPPNQSQMIVDALAAKGVRHEYHTYEGEQHGFRKADTIVHSLEAELAFYRSVFNA